VGFVISHLLDPTPTEIHVFTALASKSELFVVTSENDQFWKISGEKGLATITPMGSVKGK
jgi:hypothetical protein